MPRPHRRLRCTAGGQSTSQTSSHCWARPPSTSLIASMTTKGAFGFLGPRQKGLDTAPYGGMSDRLQIAQRCFVVEHDLRQRGSVQAAVGVEDGVAKALPYRGQCWLARRGRLARQLVRVDTVPPSPASIWPTVDLPQPIGPVSPMSGGPIAVIVEPAQRGSASILRLGEGGIHVGELTCHPSQLDEIRLHAWIAEGELELALAQSKSGQVVLHEQFASLVGVLRQRWPLAARSPAPVRRARGLRQGGLGLRFGRRSSRSRGRP